MATILSMNPGTWVLPSVRVPEILTIPIPEILATPT
jgi:hypothetical protein